MPEISAVIITHNEESHIGQCLSSLKDIADEIVVVDSFSTDNTEEICKSFNVRIIKHSFEGYVQQKNFATEQALHPLVLSLDADESLSRELKESIQKVKQNPEYDGYYFNRLNNYCGKWIRHSGWYPDRHLRLFFRTKGTWDGLNPHDSFRLFPGTRSARLKGDLYHWGFATYRDHIEKAELFSGISAEEYHRAGIKAGPLSALIHTAWTFFRSYVIYAGFLDGKAGYRLCSIAAYGTYQKYSRLRKLGKLKKESDLKQ